MRWFLAVLLLLLTACPRPGVTPDDGTPATGERPKVALVLGGGGARGFAHVGVIRALEQEKIPIDMIVGTSVGALIGSMYAARPDSFELESTAFHFDSANLLDFSLMSVTTGPVKGEAIRNFVKSYIKVDNIEDLTIPTIIVATDLNTGERVDLTEGDLAESVRASVSIPGVFTPTELNGRTLVDGGIVANVPVKVAREHGADVIIAVNITENVVDHDLTNVVEIIVQSVNIMMGEMSAGQLADADVVIAPDVAHVGTFAFEKKTETMRAGVRAARTAMPLIRQAVGLAPSAPKAPTKR